VIKVEKKEVRSNQEKKVWMEEKNITQLKGVERKHHEG